MNWGRVLLYLLILGLLQYAIFSLTSRDGALSRAFGKVM